MNTEKRTRRRNTGGRVRIPPTGEQVNTEIIWGRTFAEVIADAGVVIKDKIHISGSRDTLKDSELVVGFDPASNYMIVMDSERKILSQGVVSFTDHASPAGPGAEAKD